MTTDSKDYLEDSIKEFQKASLLKPYFSNPHYITEWKDFGSSFFARLWKEKNRTIFYTGFEKCL